MSHAPASTEVSLVPSEGWHCSHLYYRFHRAHLNKLSAEELAAGKQAFIAALDPKADGAPARLQPSVVSGHKADFGLMLMDGDPLRIDAVHQRLMSGPLGAALEPTYSFVSMTEVSEYVPSVEQYGERLVAEGEDPNGPAYKAKLKAYETREVMMRTQRLTPDLPSLAGHLLLSHATRAGWWEPTGFSCRFPSAIKLMAEHGRTGMTFGGRVTQLITVGLGYDDWEWGVTLWAAQPPVLERHRLSDAI